MSRTASRRPRMSPDAYAGFLRLMLTPLSDVPRPSRDLEAYLRYANQVDPSRALTAETDRAA